MTSGSRGSMQEKNELARDSEGPRASSAAARNFRESVGRASMGAVIGLLSTVAVLQFKLEAGKGQVYLLVGALIGAAVGHPLAGAAIGGVLGGGTGYVIGNGMQNQEHANEQTQAQVQSQQQEIENQRQQIQQLRSQSETE